MSENVLIGVAIVSLVLVVVMGIRANTRQAQPLIRDDGPQTRMMKLDETVFVAPPELQPAMTHCQDARTLCGFALRAVTRQDLDARLATAEKMLRLARLSLREVR